MTQFQIAAGRMAALYTMSFGGKASGRFRMSSKQVKDLLGRKRLYEDDVEQLKRASLEAGFVLIDMDSFFVMLSANAFVNYRRVSAEALASTVSKTC